jgi:ABC-type molybdate transport system substrate-binding protein
MTEILLPAIPSERSDDLHHMAHLNDADLVLFMAGNQFMVMPALISAFQKEHPQIRRIFYETLPPGLELKQILAGGATFDNQVLRILPDIYTSVSEAAMKTLVERRKIREGDYRLYLHNRLTLMVQAGNPSKIETIQNLSRDDIRISQPDPKNEDIGRHIINMYRQAGGEALVHRIMEEKRAEGTTIFTIVHHRETPLRIAKKTIDVGPVWATEVVHARSTDLGFDVVEPGKSIDQRHSVNYYICRLQDSPNPENAKKFIDFILSQTAQNIYSAYGFSPISF